MKNPSIPEIPPYGVSLTYNFSTRHTTAFIRGANAVMRDLKDPDAPPGTKDNFKYPALKLHYKLFSELETTMPLWGHPLLVPVILLKAELDGIRNFARDRLDSGSLNIQATMSMDYEDQAAVLGGENANRRGRQDRVDFTNGLNRLLCSAYSVRRALGVARQAAGFLLGVLEEMDPDRLLLLPGEDKVSRRENQQIKDTIRALDRGAAGFEAGIDSIISSLDVQLNIVCTLLPLPISIYLHIQATGTGESINPEFTTIYSKGDNCMGSHPMSIYLMRNYPMGDNPKAIAIPGSWRQFS